MNKRKMVPTKDLSRLEWLELRRHGIGGSDVSVIMGVNRYRSVQMLWEEKTGQAPICDTGNEATYWGNIMEPIIRKEFYKRTGLKVRQRHAMIFHPDYPYMFADLDGIVTDETGQKYIFEAKTVSEYKEDQWKDGKIPYEYYLQVQHYMEVTGMDRTYIAAVIGGNRFVFHTIEKDEDTVQLILSAEKKFWECVENMERPELDGSKATAEYLDKRYAGGIMDSISLDDSMERVLEEYDRISENMEQLKTEKDKLVNQLKYAMQDHERGTVGNRIINWKTIRRTTLDGKRLKADEPELYQKYENSVAYRKFTVA